MLSRIPDTLGVILDERVPCKYMCKKKSVSAARKAGAPRRRNQTANILRSA